MFTLDLGIDLGTANTLVYAANHGIIVREPSTIAVSVRDRKVLAVGEEAYNMAGKTPENIVVVRPLKDGNIADYDATLEMIKYYIGKAKKELKLIPFIPRRMRLVIGVPSGATQVQRRAVEEAAEAAGAREVYLIAEPMAAAIGAGLPVEKPQGNMVMDIGGGTTEIATISLGGLVEVKSVNAAGDAMNQAIVDYMRNNEKLFIGERTAEDIKIKIGKAHPEVPDKEMKVTGRDVTSGLSRSVYVNSTQVLEAIQPILDKMVKAAWETLANTPPELHKDIVENGLWLTGGGALLKGLDRLLREKLNVPVRVADNPLECVVLGTGKVLENVNLLKAVLGENR